MIWLPVAVLLVSQPSFIVWTFREIRRLERQHASLARSVEDLEDDVIGLTHPPKGTT